MVGKLHIDWTDACGNKYSNVIVEGDGTITRINKNGGSVTKMEAV